MFEKYADGKCNLLQVLRALGLRHVEELAGLVRPGRRAILLFHVGHEGGEWVEVADDIDPAYGRALRASVARGLEVFARRCRMDADGLVLGETVPVKL